MRMRHVFGWLLLLCFVASVGCQSLEVPPGWSTWPERTKRKLRGKSMEEALNDLNAVEPDRRRESIETLSQIPAIQNRPELHARLAEMALGAKEGGDFFPPDPDVQVRVACLEGLLSSRVELQPDQLDRLRGCLDVLEPGVPEARETNRRTVWLRVTAASYLSRQPNAQAAERLVQALRADPAPEVRLAAAASLQEFKTVEPALRPKIGEALIENVALTDPRGFALKFQCLTSLRELTGRGDLEYDPDGWRQHFAEHAADPFAEAGTLPRPEAFRPGFLQQIGLTVDRLLYIFRKPARSEE